MAVPCTLIPGDGIGPDITDATVRVLEAAGAKFDWDTRLAGMAAVAKFDDPMPDETIESIEKTGLALKGPLETPVGGGYRSVNVALRRTFDLYANVRPARSVVSGGRFDNVNIVLIRENTEGLYSGIEHFISIGSDPRAAAESTAVVTRFGSERIIRYAFEYAVAHGRKKVTLVHKANILKMTGGLFREVGATIAKEYAGRVEYEERIVDAMAMQLVIKPEVFDVVVTTNLFGDILSDLISGLVGGLGLAPGANLGTNAAIFEAVHGTAPDIAGKGVANPGALIYAACLMLEHLNDHARGARIRDAMESVIREQKTVTRDLGGSATTAQFTDAIIARLA
ncbi:MAG TPA: isocitrate/isopropylmalate family dehydrogenase [Kofleriaceae bacterium]|nr:isocitrate/isopropylmalate family dehydrogenase [Kofleriaceae bacterium]